MSAAHIEPAPRSWFSRRALLALLGGAAVVAALAAVGDTREHAGGAVANQVDDQAVALDRAVDGFVGTYTATDSWDVDLYQGELNTAVDDLANNADQFSSQGPGVRQAFWDGYQSGLSD